jgi:hypothetical protein
MNLLLGGRPRHVDAGAAARGNSIVLVSAARFGGRFGIVGGHFRVEVECSTGQVNGVGSGCK